MRSVRPSRDQVYMEIAHVFSRRSTCVRGQVGALIVVENRIVSSGYNGAPPHLPECTEVGCLVVDGQEQLGCQRAIHAEANAIAWAARNGVATKSATIYCTAGPCLKCAQQILAAGITEVVYEIPYRLTDGIELLDRALVKVRQYTRIDNPQKGDKWDD